MSKKIYSIILNVRRLSLSGQRFALLLVIPLVVVVSIPLVLRVMRVPSAHRILSRIRASRLNLPELKLPDTKRLMDVVLAATALLFLAPVLIMTAILIRIKMGSPVLFQQERTGLHGNPFVLYKFRTMTNARDAQGQLLPDAERIPSLGHLIRKTSLDELPQLINILRGDMSLVGPRPLLPEYRSLYTLDQARRLEAKPGITGWAQIKGRNSLTWEEKFALDVWYVDHSNFWLDLKILAATVPIVLRRGGISQVNHVTAARFAGSKNG